jgi:hypothetical protein
MDESYKQCHECGKRALRIATRCPGCGRSFPRTAVRDVGRLGELDLCITPRGVVAGLAIAAIVVSARSSRSSEPREQHPVFGAAAAAAISSEVAAPPAALTWPGAKPRLGAVCAARPARSERRVARRMTHVRKAGSSVAQLEAVLMPGDTVEADSVGPGWYRVAVEGKVLGYARGTTLMVVETPEE